MTHDTDPTFACTFNVGRREDVTRTDTLGGALDYARDNGCNGTLRDAAGAVRFHVYADGSYTRQ